ncbi:toxin-antitoxin system HicB family antitoxin [Deinococcus planocerae]|uniref:toxin-antitoxin system HicB family antitoxin n=1 Tax=Deinococcus planocerae TaxID=1737569 RepID=UPI000C7EB0AF|nr:toxin-antitoxin system HicB family antitoxin [Deinococcus planocerae]
MQTTLRLDDDLHRRAKMEAARRGITLTQLVEEGLRAQLEASAAGSRPPVVLPTFDSGLSFNFTAQEIKAMMNDDSEQLARLGLTPEAASPKK